MSAMPRVVIALSHAQDVETWRARHEAGEVLDATPYGYHVAGDRFDLRWTLSHPETAAVARIRRALAARLGFDVVHMWRNRRLLRDADVIWTHTEREHLAVAAVLGRSHPPVLAQSVWLWDAWADMSAARRRIAARLLRRHAVEIVHSAANLEASRALVPGRRVELVPFGTAALPDVRGEELSHPPLVVAVGNDADRDWPLLARVAEMLPECRFMIVSGSRTARAIVWGSNVELRPVTSRDELVAAFADASCSVVPLRDNLHASGTTSCLEAMSAGRPLIVSAAGGIDDYVAGAAMLVPPSDDAAMAAAIVEAVGGRVAAPAVDAVESRGLTQADYVERYARITDWILGGAWDDEVSRFSSLTRPAT